MLLFQINFGTIWCSRFCISIGTLSDGGVFGHVSDCNWLRVFGSKLSDGGVLGHVPVEGLWEQMLLVSWGIPGAQAGSKIYCVHLPRIPSKAGRIPLLWSHRAMTVCLPRCLIFRGGFFSKWPSQRGWHRYSSRLLVKSTWVLPSFELIEVAHSSPGFGEQRLNLGFELGFLLGYFFC